MLSYPYLFIFYCFRNCTAAAATTDCIWSKWFYVQFSFFLSSFSFNSLFMLLVVWIFFCRDVCEIKLKQANDISWWRREVVACFFFLIFLPRVPSYYSFASSAIHSLYSLSPYSPGPNIAGIICYNFYNRSVRQDKLLMSKHFMYQFYVQQLETTIRKWKAAKEGKKMPNLEQNHQQIDKKRQEATEAQQFSIQI